MMRAYCVYMITELDFFGFELECLDECEEVIHTQRFLSLDDAEEMGEKYLDGVDPENFPIFCDCCVDIRRAERELGPLQDPNEYA